MRKMTLLHTIFIFLAIFVFTTTKAQEYTRGVGIYPGNAKEDFSPSIRIDNATYRNLALHRPAYNSSSYDYNLTAQLVTDGIKESQPPPFVVTTYSDGIAKKNEREWILDRHMMTGKNLGGPNVWAQIEISGNSIIPQVDSIAVLGSLLVDSLEPQHWEMAVSVSDEGRNWETLGTVSGGGLPGDTITGFYRKFLPPNFRIFNYPFDLKKPSHHRFYRVDLHSPNAKSWGIGEFAMFTNGTRSIIGGPYRFSSAWMSEGKGDEWVYVDLGAECSFDRIVLYWLHRATAGSIQVSDDASHWKDVMLLPKNWGYTDDIKLSKPVTGRYVRVLLKKPAIDGNYILSELEVYGRGGPVAVPHAQPSVKEDGKLYLSGGAWKLQRSSQVHADGGALSRPGFNDSSWIVATVPATVLVSYLNVGALPDPNYGDNQLMISDSYFYSDFWYRDEFSAPASYKGKRISLNFDGINWKAEVFLNGQKLGRIEGAFTRGQFDVSGIIIPGKKNVIAVHIEKNAAPGFVTEQTKFSPDANGGELGADNPTFHASIGWDWIPTIRGRNTGIWNDVYLSVSGPVTIENPFISTKLPLPDTSSADVIIEAHLYNHSSERVTGMLRGKFGGVAFEQSVTLKASEKARVRFNSSTHPSLHLHNPALWWPNGYGKPNLYNVELTFVLADDRVSDSISFSTGIREMTYSEDGGILKIWINGRRFIGKGGNWGFSESMLRYRGREYDIAVRYHKEMNFTMIRNWVGQTGDEEFYKACDRHGIMIWQDFWLANPVDGPNPSNNNMFVRNVEDFVKRIRNHPSLALYCGRNEGNPPEVIDSAIRKLLEELHPDVHYISNSAFGVVSGGGPYRAMPTKFYFEKRATEKLHSEMGMPDIVSFESLKQMMPDSAIWPRERMWGIHDFCLNGAQGGSSFIQQLEESFGPVNDLKEWLSFSQWMNYQGYRAMFEAQGKNRMGMLLWMSHPAWPSLVWQTYDYYFEPTAAYFGCKKACEPLHIQWNPLSDSIEVVNYSDPNGRELTASMEIIGLDGTVKIKRKTTMSCPEDSIIHCFSIESADSLSRVCFIRLKLEKGGEVISENFYWHGLEEGDLKAIRRLPKVKLDSDTRAEQKGNRWYLTTSLKNNTDQPALMVVLKVTGEKSGERILPVIYSDNYISLMPGEQRLVKMELENADTHGEKPVVGFGGFSIEE